MLGWSSTLEPAGLLEGARWGQESPPEDDGAGAAYRALVFLPSSAEAQRPLGILAAAVPCDINEAMDQWCCIVLRSGCICWTMASLSNL